MEWIVEDISCHFLRPRASFFAPRPNSNACFRGTIEPARWRATAESCLRPMTIGKSSRFLMIRTARELRDQQTTSSGRPLQPANGAAFRLGVLRSQQTEEVISWFSSRVRTIQGCLLQRFTSGITRPGGPHTTLLPCRSSFTRFKVRAPSEAHQVIRSFSSQYSSNRSCDSTLCFKQTFDVPREWRFE